MNELGVGFHASPVSSEVSRLFNLASSHCDLVPLCPSPIQYQTVAYRSRWIPDPLDTRYPVSKSWCVQVSLSISPIVCPSPVRNEPHCVPVLLDTSPIVSWSHCVLVPLDTSPIVSWSHWIPAPLCPGPTGFQS